MAPASRAAAVAQDTTQSVISPASPRIPQNPRGWDGAAADWTAVLGWIGWLR